MTIEYGHDVFSLAPGESIFLDTIFNSSDFNAGGGIWGQWWWPELHLLTTKPKSTDNEDWALVFIQT